MNINCIHCGEPIRIDDAKDGDWLECPHCEAETQVPSTRLKRRGDSDRDSRQPFLLPVAIPTEDAELTDERKKDLQEIRRYRTEDRLGNPVGTSGFAIGVTAFLLLFSAVALHRFIPLYLWFVAVLSLPAALLGLILSIVGSLLVGRPKLFSLIGAGIGAFLILIGIPASFLLLKGF